MKTSKHLMPLTEVSFRRKDTEVGMWITVQTPQLLQDTFVLFHHLSNFGIPDFLFQSTGLKEQCLNINTDLIMLKIVVVLVTAS